MQPLIILPTYNEKENLKAIIREILAVGIDGLQIMVVDDGSPDGTGQIADRLAQENSKISVLHRTKKEGLGRAYVAGFKKALTNPNITHIFEMDADFSHQPKYIPDFLAMAKTHDLVLGSRNIPGGGVENWNWFRRFISWSANTMVRRILNIPVYDLTGGFKCWSRKVLEALDLDNVESSGYNFQIELTYKAYKKGFKIGETPIVFVERRAGASKFNSGIMIESLLKVIKLRFQKIK
ncbi:MAG: polyprenol monophosphomannose synthase [bacterium]|nr:polyprenol monophosphomannose synthase [bacterium]